MSDVRSLLCLSSIPRLGPLKIRSLVTHFKSPENVLRASARELIRVKGIDASLATAIAHDADGRFADDQLRMMEKAGANIITLWDNNYPDLLKKIYDPPPLLFVFGRFEPRDAFSLAIVGTRTPSPYGQKSAESFAAALSGLGLTIVSGLARGIDTIAHVTTLTSKGRTLAVIGSGLDVPYPPENRELMHRIADSGAVVSEFPMGTKPDAPHFPRRNRIISGLTLGTIIIESLEDGGAMITATTALDQNREVFAVPGSIFEKRSSGTHKLMREGQATLTNSVEDIVEELHVKLRPILKRNNEPRPLPQLTLFEQTIHGLLGEDPIHIDAISDRAQLSTPDTLVSLLSLEFKGLVKQLPGKMFLRM